MVIDALCIMVPEPRDVQFDTLGIHSLILAFHRASPSVRIRTDTGMNRDALSAKLELAGLEMESESHMALESDMELETHLQLERLRLRYSQPYPLKYPLRSVWWESGMDKVASDRDRCIYFV